MSYYVYIIHSKALNQYYVGHTQDLRDRIYRHNNSGSESTKKASDWILVYSEEYGTRSAAMKREQEIKNKRSKKYIEDLIRAKD